MPSITVYTSPGCVQCGAVKRHLRRAGIEPTIVDVSTDPDARAYLIARGWTGTPVTSTSFGDEFYGYQPHRLDTYINRSKHYEETPQ